MKRENMATIYRTFVVAVLLALLGVAARAEDADDDSAALAKALPESSVSLEQALKAAESDGKPISAKFEIEKGALQLSVYTIKGNAFDEVIVDHKSGAIKKVEKITDKEDLEDAEGQAKAMARAKMTLGAAMENATKANPGYKAVSILPVLAAVVPMAGITLMKGTDVKKVNLQLD
jgi:hypothetical protein